ncbi:hypothetical protein SBA1_690022 [Candidatus Sulfotelmatobacter kueseliae]|uniref:Uncharacterized protein n=1 Tax=Candidatus Sulfotelmatobacter kueseliae TaxID=2042962 RepID=A0A2U3L4T6_9BACT|nr:hypothetical protein SBA1_690022 [Candidatus Sulfotelmatobacter kueseliae]
MVSGNFAPFAITLRTLRSRSFVTELHCFGNRKVRRGFAKDAKKDRPHHLWNCFNLSPMVSPLPSLPWLYSSGYASLRFAHL